jgi:hypothetical protein
LSWLAWSAQRVFHPPILTPKHINREEVCERVNKYTIRVYSIRLYSEKEHFTIEEIVEAESLSEAIKKGIELVSVGNDILPSRDMCVKAVTRIYE